MELSEKEDKALWYFSEVLTYEVDKKQWKVIENLVEKQKKEIEELETRLQEEIKEKCELKTELYLMSVSKDKIREIITEYQKQLESADTERTAIMLSNFIMVLIDLLEEN